MEIYYRRNSIYHCCGDAVCHPTTFQGAFFIIGMAFWVIGAAIARRKRAVAHSKNKVNKSMDKQ